MQVLIHNYSKFLQYRINILDTKLKDLQSKYAACKEIYERKLLPRTFGWKYEDSGGGNRCYLFGNWDFWSLEMPLQRYAEEMRRVTYHVKLGDAMISLPENYQTMFYKFAEDNNLPY